MQQCPTCQSDLTIKTAMGFIVKYCENIPHCTRGFIEIKCAQHVWFDATLTSEAGRILPRKQCSQCGDVTVAKSGEVNLSLAKEVSRSLEKEKREYVMDVHRRYNDLKQRKEREWFFSEHSKYLNSEAWREKRKKVLKRDGFVCQSCLDQAATEVHHLSYQHWQDEPLFELTSVCKPCHDKIHKKD